MQTQTTHFFPNNANPVFLVSDKTPRTEHNYVPIVSRAAEELANMRGWIAGIAGITILHVRCLDREAGNQYRPFRHTGSSVVYRTHNGDERAWSINTFGLDATVQGVRLEWWHHRLLLAHLLESRWPCTRCHGESTSMDGTRSIDLRYSAKCNRCWSRRADPVILDMIAAGGDPSKTEFVVLRPIE